MLLRRAQMRTIHHWKRRRAVHRLRLKGNKLGVFLYNAYAIATNVYQSVLMPVESRMSEMMRQVHLWLRSRRVFPTCLIHFLIVARSGKEHGHVKTDFLIGLLRPLDLTNIRCIELPTGDAPVRNERRICDYRSLSLLALM